MSLHFFLSLVVFFSLLHFSFSPLSLQEGGLRELLGGGSAAGWGYPTIVGILNEG